MRAATPLRGAVDGGAGLWTGISTREVTEIAKGLIKCKPTHFKAVRILTRSDYLFSVCAPLFALRSPPLTPSPPILGSRLSFSSLILSTPAAACDLSACTHASLTPHPSPHDASSGRTDHDGKTRSEVLSTLSPWRRAFVVANCLILLICLVALGLAAAAVVLNGWPAATVAWEAYGVGGACSWLGLLALIGLWGAHDLKRDLQVVLPPTFLSRAPDALPPQWHWHIPVPHQHPLPHAPPSPSLPSRVACSAAAAPSATRTARRPRRRL